MKRSQSAIITYLQLSRIPNLFTVPGDVIAGAALAGLFTAKNPDYLPVIITIFISLFIYIAGLWLNDYFDHEIDLKERPDRPIPSGHIKRVTVLGIATTLLISAIGLSACLNSKNAMVCVLLVGLVISYNAFAKKIPIIGTATMALCRVGSLLLGISAYTPDKLQSSMILITSVALFSYIFIVAQIAVNEMDRLPSKIYILAIALSPLLLLLSGSHSLFKPGCLATWLSIIVFLLNTEALAFKLFNNKEITKTGPLVGALIRNLIFMQCFWIAVNGGNCIWAVAVFLLWPVAGYAGRKFYGS
ncbi:UbiA family prenyltransferase [bacterium AH-315-E10]|nr:UbiA family prenyltransferase [bacterium AH-315-E10]